MQKRIHLNAFSMNCVSHIQHGLWVRDDTRQREFNRIEPWIELARLLERGGFDALFLADVIGTYDLYRGGPETAIQEAVQIPANDPMPLIPAMATATEHLGFAFTSSVLQVPPFTFARQISTLDHITRGRIAWNIVTSYLPNAGTNLGLGGLPPHDERYARAEEYLEVAYKLWEGKLGGGRGALRHHARPLCRPRQDPLHRPRGPVLRGRGAASLRAVAAADAAALPGGLVGARARVRRHPCGVRLHVRLHAKPQGVYRRGAGHSRPRRAPGSAARGHPVLPGRDACGGRNRGRGQGQGGGLRGAVERRRRARAHERQRRRGLGRDRPRRIAGEP